MGGVIGNLKGYWNGNAEAYGDSPRALDWGSRDSQNRRFAILCGLLPAENFSVLDVGSGLGDLFDWMRPRFRSFRYRGVDISPRMVEIARGKHPDLPPETFTVHDMAELLAERFDYVLLSGTLNKKIGDTMEQYLWALRVLLNCWNCTRRGMAFNMLSSHADHVSVTDFTYDPLIVLKLLMGLSRWVKLDHTYMPHDFAVFIWREKPPWSA